MKILGTYLTFLNESSEKESILRIRKNEKAVWLYHTTEKKYVDNIKKNGLDPNFMGQEHAAYSQHPTGKPTLSYSSYKAYSKMYGGITLLVLVPTDNLFFAIHSKPKWYSRHGADEYLSTKIIEPKNIIFPNDKRYDEIEKENSYLDTSLKL